MKKYLLASLALISTSAYASDHTFDRADLGMKRSEIFAVYADKLKPTCKELCLNKKGDDFWQLQIADNQYVRVMYEYTDKSLDGTIKKIMIEDNGGKPNAPAVLAKLKEKYGEPDTADQTTEKSQRSCISGFCVGGWSFDTKLYTWSKEKMTVRMLIKYVNNPDTGYQISFEQTDSTQITAF